MLFGSRKSTMVGREDALPGRDVRPYDVSATHAVLGTPLEGQLPAGFEEAVFGLGCFWGAERIFWRVPGVYSTSAGYAGGYTPHPTYDEVCSARTGHAEVVRVVFDPTTVTYEQLLKVFWEAHDPTQGHRQGNDIGTQYRSAIYYTNDEQRQLAEASRAGYQDRLKAASYGEITTEIAPLGDYYAAEDYHQQYLYKVPDGYCGIGGTGVSCPIGVVTAD